MVAVGVPPTRIAETAAAVLTEQEPAAGLTELPAFDAAGLGALRAIAEASWAAPGQVA